MTAIDVRATRRCLRHEDLEYSVDIANRYMNVAKVPFVVREGDVAMVSSVICTHSRTGAKRDGRTYVSPVEQAIYIRTGSNGQAAVESPGD